MSYSSLLAGGDSSQPNATEIYCVLTSRSLRVEGLYREGLQLCTDWVVWSGLCNNGFIKLPLLPGLTSVTEHICGAFLPRGLLRLRCSANTASPCS